MNRPLWKLAFDREFTGNAQGSRTAAYFWVCGTCRTEWHCCVDHVAIVLKAVSRHPEGVRSTTVGIQKIPYIVSCTVFWMAAVALAPSRIAIVAHILHMRVLVPRNNAAPN